MRLSVVLLAIFPLSAAAQCLLGGQVISCQMGAKTLEICTEPKALIYAFGPAGKPEMLISEPLATVTFKP